METNINYAKAVEELEDIVEKMENDDLDLDQMGQQLKRARELVKLCKDRLTKTDEEIRRILDDEAQ